MPQKCCMMVFTHKMNTTNFLAFGGPKLLAFICGKHRLVLQIIKPIFSCPNGWGKYMLVGRQYEHAFSEHLIIKSLRVL